MPQFRFASASVACAAFLSLPTAVSADSGVGISAYVPVVCTAQIAVGGAGGLEEVCNNPGGYQLWIDYPASLADAVLVIDGQHFDLNDTGTVLVESSAGPALRHRSLTLVGALEADLQQLSPRMTPADHP